MVLMKMTSTQRNVQVFRGGKVQILGAVSDAEAESMRQEFERKLKRIKKMESCQVSSLTIKNMVVSLKLKLPVNLRKIVCSNEVLSYEVELFPAALIRKWHPIHVALFHNGKMIVTGVRSLSTLNDIVNSVSLLRSYSFWIPWQSHDELMTINSPTSHGNYMNSIKDIMPGNCLDKVCAAR